MPTNDEFRFVSLLALELENGDISLPSLPDVVLKSRKLLESDNCDFERISQVVAVDPVLVSKLFIYANSVFYNRSDIKAETLDAAISRLGFEVVRNTAMSLAMKQLYNTDTRDEVARYVREVWLQGIKLSCMAHALARSQSSLNQETAYLCGLMHEVGKLYILTKAEEFPDFLGDTEKLEAVMREWNPQISKSIVESWDFPNDVIESTDPETYAHPEEDAEPSMLDIMVVADTLLENASEDDVIAFAESPSWQRLGMSDAAAAKVMERYQEKLETVQQSLA